MNRSPHNLKLLVLQPSPPSEQPCALWPHGLRSAAGAVTCSPSADQIPCIQRPRTAVNQGQ